MKKINFIILVCIAMHATAQKEYKVGDKIPDFKIQLIAQKNKVSVTDFYKGKYLILDFWGIYCHPCVEALPKLDSLRKLFPGKLEIIAINENFSKAPDKTREFLNKNAQLSKLTMPFAVDDGKIKKYFTGDNQLPSEIWIDPKGYIQARTDGEAMTYENVKKFVTEAIAPVAYTRNMIKIDPFNGPFPTGDTGFQFRSILKKFDINVPESRILRGFINADPGNKNNTRRIYYSGATIKDLFLTAVFGDEIPLSQKGRFILNAKDSLRYLRPEEVEKSYNKTKYNTRTDWALENTFIYELILPQLTNNKIVLNEYMLNDLNRYFDVTGTIEMIEMPCYLIVNIAEESKTLKSSGGESIWLMDSVSNGRPAPYITGIKNKSMNEIADKLSTLSYDLPFVNSTINSLKIDMALSPAIPGFSTQIDIDTLRQAFNKYGFDIIKGKGKIKVVAINEKQKTV